ncbi:MAG: histidine kinase N-terminal domain-containing protein [Chloroflexi bacterium]|nr:histidine kinase N-terminal domain-containing protein [Chloroflexota bacterium]
MDSEVLEREVERQQRICDGLPLCADILRADVLYYELLAPARLVVVEHAQPHSTPSVEVRSRKGDSEAPDPGSALGKALRGKPVADALVQIASGPTRVHQEYRPVRDRHGEILGAIGIESSAVEHERRAQNRNPHFKRAMQLLKDLMVGPGLAPVSGTATFQAHDGLVVLDSGRRVRYVSSAADGLYRRLGFNKSLDGRTIEALDAGDESAVWQAIHEKSGVVLEGPARDQTWVRTAIPLVPPGRSRPDYVLLLLRDVTATRRFERETESLANISHEIHHRFGNNLQQLISYARMRGREAQHDETRQAMSDLETRLFAVAKIHEYLTVPGVNQIELKDVCRQIADQIRVGLLPADTRISIDIEGDPTPLQSKQATFCALIVNELLQNAVEHAFGAEGGTIRVGLEDDNGQITISVIDDGRGLSPGFDARKPGTYGLQIARGFARDLRGELELINQAFPAHGLVARLTFSRLIPGGK